MRCVDDALSGMARGAQDEERMNEILTLRHPGEIEDIKHEYAKLCRDKKTGHVDKNALWNDVCSDTGFKYEEFLKCMLDRTGYFAFLAYDAMHRAGMGTGLGTNDGRLIAIFGALNRDNASLEAIIDQFQDPFGSGWKEKLERQVMLPDIQEVKAAYVELWDRGFGVNEARKTMERSIDEDCGKIFSAGFREILLAFIRERVRADLPPRAPQHTAG